MLQKPKADPRFPKLFTPGRIGNLWVKNRLIKAPTATRFADSEGYVTQRMISHYRELARGGVGLVIVEFAYVDEKASQAMACQLDASRDEALSSLDWLARTINDNGARSCLQLVHAGMVRLQGKPPVKAPSSITWPSYLPIPDPEELRVGEIEEIVQAFGDAALRAKKTGFDMVEVHGAHGYLITNFLSPHFNKRKDRYGGSLAGRMRFLLEIIDDIKEKAGPDYPISVRLSATDYAEEEPITIEETKPVAKAVEEAGVDMINVSYGGHTSLGREPSTMYSPRAANVWLAEEVKKVVSIPVAAVGSITTPDLAEKILGEGRADFIALARSLLTDPHYPRKAQEGRPEDIRPCIRCSDGCYDRGIYVGSVKCTVNPALGREDEYRIRPAAKQKRVAVVGGGPAGLEAARVAALRGHEVTLFEQKELGGMLIPASIPEFKADIRNFVQYLVLQVEKAGVHIVKSRATGETLGKGQFDGVIVANGATPWFPDVPGIDESAVLNPLDVLNGTETGECVIVVGGGMIGSDVALYLAEQGKKVTITTRRDEIEGALSRRARGAYFIRLSKQDVDIRTGEHLESVNGSSIVITNRTGERSEIKGDSIVIASGLKPDRMLFEELAGLNEWDEVYAVGDCVEPRTILEAIQEGCAAAFLP